MLLPTSGTDLGHAATRHWIRRLGRRLCYAMSDTDLRYATRCPTIPRDARHRHELCCYQRAMRCPTILLRCALRCPVLRKAIRLCACYGMSGTEKAYGATSRHVSVLELRVSVLGSTLQYHPTHCPVLICNGSLPSYKPVMYAVAGNDTGHVTARMGTAVSCQSSSTAR
eukprot:2898370-Rhodomonas_salina.1